MTLFEAHASPSLAQYTMRHVVQALGERYHVPRDIGGELSERQIQLLTENLKREILYHRRVHDCPTVRLTGGVSPLMGESQGNGCNLALAATSIGDPSVYPLNTWNAIRTDCMDSSTLSHFERLRDIQALYETQQLYADHLYRSAHRNPSSLHPQLIPENFSLVHVPVSTQAPRLLSKDTFHDVARGSTKRAVVIPLPLLDNEQKDQGITFPTRKQGLHTADSHGRDSGSNPRRSVRFQWIDEGKQSQTSAKSEYPTEQSDVTYRAKRLKFKQLEEVTLRALNESEAVESNSEVIVPKAHPVPKKNVLGEMALAPAPKPLKERKPKGHDFLRRPDIRCLTNDASVLQSTLPQENVMNSNDTAVPTLQHALQQMQPPAKKKNGLFRKIAKKVTSLTHWLQKHHL